MRSEFLTKLKIKNNGWNILHIPAPSSIRKKYIRSEYLSHLQNIRKSRMVKLFFKAMDSVEPKQFIMDITYKWSPK